MNKKPFIIICRKKIDNTINDNEHGQLIKETVINTLFTKTYFQSQEISTIKTLSYLPT